MAEWNLSMPKKNDPFLAEYIFSLSTTKGDGNLQRAIEDIINMFFLLFTLFIRKIKIQFKNIYTSIIHHLKYKLLVTTT